MKIAFVIYYGPEIRTYIHSGLLQKMLNRNFSVTLISKFNISQDVFRFSEKINFLQFPLLEHKKLKYKIYSIINKYFNKCFESRLRLLGFGNFHFSEGVSNNKKFYDYLFGSTYFIKLFENLLSIFAKTLIDSKKLNHFVLNNQFDKIIFSNNIDIDVTRLLFIYRENNTELDYILSNWKDVYMNHHFKFIPEKVFYWSKKLYEDAIQIDHKISKSNAYISGNPFFYSFDNIKTDKKKISLQKKYKIPNNKKIILWATAQETMLKNEYKLIQRVSKILSKNFSNPPIILVRQNPFSKKINNYFAENKNIRFCDEFWLNNRSNDILYLNKPGEDEWKNILKSSNLIISVPSTITLEAAINDVMVFNFIFDEHNKIIEKLSGFVNSSFYNDLIRENYCKIFNSEEQIIKAVIDYILNNKFCKHNSLPKIIFGNESYNCDLLIDNLQE